MLSEILTSYVAQTDIAVGASLWTIRYQGFFFLPWHNTRNEKKISYCDCTGVFLLLSHRLFFYNRVYVWTIELSKMNLLCEFINHYMSVVCFYRDFACSYSDVVSFCHCVECMFLSLFSVVLSLYKCAFIIIRRACVM